MNRKVAGYLFLFFFGCLHAVGQTCQVPKTYNFRTSGDYDSHAENVYECMTFLAAKPLHADRAVRSQALIYVLTWLQGSPSVSVRTFSEFLIFEEECPDLVPEFVYLLAWQMKAQNRNCDSGIHFSALQNLLQLYKKSEGLNCPSLDKLAEMSETDLETWVSVQYRLAVGEH